MAKKYPNANQIGGLRDLEIFVGEELRGKDKDIVMRYNPDGVIRGRGLIPRDYRQYPQEMFESPDKVKLIPRSEWSDRIKEKVKKRSQLSDIIKRGNKKKSIPSMDQGPNGYCWGHSTTAVVMTVRALQNMLYIPLSAYMVCAIIKRGRNQGGWCGLSAEFIREHGICTQTKWPQGNRNLNLDTPQVRKEAKLFRTTEDWVDLSRAVYDQNLAFDVIATLLLNNIPVAGDFNWWAHSVLLCDLVEIEPGHFAIRIRNSWGPGWGDEGFGVLTESKSRTNGAIAIRSLNVIDLTTVEQESTPTTIAL